MVVLTFPQHQPGENVPQTLAEGRKTNRGFTIESRKLTSVEGSPRSRLKTRSAAVQSALAPNAAGAFVKISFCAVSVTSHSQDAPTRLQLCSSYKQQGDADFC